MQGVSQAEHETRPKTLGRQAAKLVTGLHERQRTLFTLAEVEAEKLTPRRAPGRGVSRRSVGFMA